MSAIIKHTEVSSDVLKFTVAFVLVIEATSI